MDDYKRLGGSLPVGHHHFEPDSREHFEPSQKRFLMPNEAQLNRIEAKLDELLGLLKKNPDKFPYFDHRGLD